MRVVVLGGTRFIGRHVVAELQQAGHELLVVHRGLHAAPALESVRELRTDRSDLASHAATIAAFAPHGVVDVSAMTDEHARIALEAIPGSLARVAISSMDVYRAFTALWDGTVTDSVPLREDSPLRTTPPPDRRHVTSGYDYDAASYEKLDVERRYLAAGASVCRLPMVYGPYDYQLREEPILGRIRAGRTRIPIGAGNWLWSRGYAPELARGVRLALESEQARGEAFNLCEAACASMEMWVRQIAHVARWDGEFVRVPDSALPDDLEILGALGQQWLVDATKAAEVLAWTHADPWRCVEASVRWHLENPPAQTATDFSADDRALAAL